MPVCLTTDLIDSKQLPDRARIQTTVEDTLAWINGDLKTGILVPFSMTAGDEWQGLVETTALAYEVDFAIRRRLHPLRMRSGIGVGEIGTPLRDRTASMDGPCFHRSREALQRSKNRKGPSTELKSDLVWLDDYLNAQERVLLTTIDDWTETQFATAMAFLDLGTESAAAEHLGVKQPTVHRSLAGANAKEILRAIAARNRFLQTAEVEWMGKPEA